MGGMEGGRYDAIIIGSGVGGGMAAHGLVEAGLRVLVIERGDWVRRGPHNWEEDGAVNLTPQYSMETPYERAGRRRDAVGSVHCVGGPSVFYGAVSMRLRERDFHPDRRLHGELGGWPLGYEALEPYYARAERLLGVAGRRGADPTEPLRSSPYPASPAELSPISAPASRRRPGGSVAIPFRCRSRFASRASGASASGARRATASPAR